MKEVVDQVQVQPQQLQLDYVVLQLEQKPWVQLLLQVKDVAQPV